MQRRYVPALRGVAALMITGSLLTACSREFTLPANPTVGSGGRVETPEARRPTETPNARRATETVRAAETPTPRPATVVATLIAGKLGVAPTKGEDCPGDHPIKGSFDDKKRTYYTPSSSDYKHEDADICFATEQDAQAEGFQAATK